MILSFGKSIITLDIDINTVKLIIYPIVVITLSIRVECFHRKFTLNPEKSFIGTAGKIKLMVFIGTAGKYR